MLIDSDLPRVLMARGLSRRQVAACLREIECDGKSWQEVTTLLGESLGVTRIDCRRGGLKFEYDMAIGKGVTLKYKGDTSELQLILDKELPSAVALALESKTLETLIEHDLLPHGRLIKQITTGNGQTIVHLQNDQVEIARIIPASQRDLEIARYTWKRMRRRDAWKAGAAKGLTITTGIKAVFFSAITMTGAIIIASVFGVMQKAPILTAVSIAGMTALIAAVELWYEMTKEDIGLSSRITDLRYNRIKDRREAIMEGRQPPPMTVP